MSVKFSLHIHRDRLCNLNQFYHFQLEIEVERSNYLVERSDYCVERSDYCVERSDYCVEQSDLEQSDHGAK